MGKEISFEIKKILEKYTNRLQSIYADKLDRVILFGSYARGDYTSESDIDIMILIAGEEAYYKMDELCSMTFDMDMEHDVYIQSVTQTASIFDYWKKVHPLYRDVCEEGIVLYEAA